ncbi:HNH endonuclease [Clostridium tetani]|uniref:HNH endonuclease n=1 Tax=Clostridium tetani TaxID=1513 RepID=UPI00068C5745|nr:HNH endonuclease [Clostridium tetani]RXI68186.1 HNH endonuclease [Clostridium tetani]BDR75770.1 hypothetical protein K154306013_14300 [Clostridium tetani]BDR86886.1 hypothetical protein N071400001_14940 [Clostridium tetani]
MAIYTVCSNCCREIEQGSKCICGIDKERYKRYNKYVRYSKDNIKYTRFYNSVEWKRLSNYIRSKCNNMCIMCLLEEDKISPVDVVHHVIPIRMNFSKRLQESNLLPLCHNCHNKVDHEDITKEYVDKCVSILEKFKTKYRGE